MVRHRASLRDRVSRWWNEKPVPPAVLPIVGVVLSVLLLIGLALTLPPIIHDIITPKVPEQTAPKETPSPKQSLPPVTKAPVPQPSPTARQAPVPEQAAQPVAPEPQSVPQPIPVQPVVPLLPVQPQPVPTRPEVTAPPLPPVLGPVVGRPLDTVDKLVEGTLGTVDNTIDKVTGVLGGLLR